MKFLCHIIINLGYKLKAACVYGQYTHLDRRKRSSVVWANRRLFPANDSPIAIVVRYSGFRLWDLLVLLICSVFGFYCRDCSSEALRDMRQMERVPNVSANPVIPGEVSVHGRAIKATKSLKSRYTKIPCLYHRYLKEREEKDSDGDTRWVTVESGSEGTDFFLGDETGKVLVKLSRKGVRPDLYRDHRERQGRYRYSEWRIEEQERVYAFAMAKKDAEGLSLRFDLPGSFTPILSMTERWKIGPIMEPKRCCSAH